MSEHTAFLIEGAPAGGRLPAGLPESFVSRLRALMPLAFRRHVIACERDRLTGRALTTEDVARVATVTIGERVNYELYGRVVSARLRLREVA